MDSQKPSAFFRSNRLFGEMALKMVVPFLILLLNGKGRSEEPLILQAGEGSIFKVAISADGKMVACGSLEQRAPHDLVYVWDIQTGKKLATLQGHRHSILCVGFSPDGKILASGGTDNFVKLWEVATWKELATIETPQGNGHIAFSPDGKTLALAGAYIIQIIDLMTKKEIHRFEENARVLVFSPNGDQLVSGGMDGTVKSWDMVNRKLGPIFQRHKSYVFAVAFSLDGKLFASGSDDGTVILREMATGNRRVYDLRRKGGPVTGLAFSPDGSKLVVGSHYRRIELLDPSGERGPKVILEEEQGVFESLALSPDGKKLVIGEEGLVKILDFEQLVKKNR